MSDTRCCLFHCLASKLKLTRFFPLLFSSLLSSPLSSVSLHRTHLSTNLNASFLLPTPPHHTHSQSHDTLRPILRKQWLLLSPAQCFHSLVLGPRSDRIGYGCRFPLAAGHDDVAPQHAPHAARDDGAHAAIRQVCERRISEWQNWSIPDCGNVRRCSPSFLLDELKD